MGEGKYRSTPYHVAGIIATVDSHYYNLRTGSVITKADQSSMISDEFIFVENKYAFAGGEKFPLGVYKINFKTGEFEIFPITK